MKLYEYGRSRSFTDLCPRSLWFNVLKLLFLKTTLDRLKPNFTLSLHGILGWIYVQMFWPRWLPGPYTVKTLNISFFGTKKPMTLKLGIQHWVLKYYPIYSNDDTGLTLPIFMTWSNLFRNASAWVKAYTAYSHVFRKLFYFSISDALRWAIQDRMVLWFSPVAPV